MTDYDLMVIGGGAAGLAAAREGVRRGARTLLVADGPIGGDCTFTGCIPSKTLIEHAARGASFTTAMAAVRDAVARIAATETPQALTRESIEVLQGHAAFHGPGRVHVNGLPVRARGYVIATGARPTLPLIPGLDASATPAYLTSENVFELDRPPASMVVLGGGAVGCELAQAFQRLGVQITLLEVMDRLLPGEDSDASRIITEVLAREGVTVRTGARVEGVEHLEGGLRLRLGGEDRAEAERLLVAVGRTAETAGLGLGEAGIQTDARGFIVTDAHLATTAAGVFAAGDVTGRLQFTHAAYTMGRIAAGNALTGQRRGPRRRATYSDDGIPRVVFTDPEVAQVGLTQAAVQIARPAARMAYLPMSEVDRAVTAGRSEGFVKLIAGPRRLSGWLGGGRVLGATIVATRAGEMIHEAALAMRTGAFTGRLAQTVHAYPTWSIALQQAAAQFFGTYGQRTAHPAAQARGTGGEFQR